jgi:hypothetical protein
MPLFHRLDHPMTRVFLLSLFCLSACLAVPPLSAQEGSGDRPRTEDDPCGFSLRKTDEAQLWGYGRDELIVDLQRWILSPMLSIDVIGQSVQNRPLYHLVMTNPASQLRKRRIWIHARTHPIEAESSYAARAIVDELLGGSELGSLLLDHAYVHVLPMLNPDGVELRRARENANGVDLESNWGAASPEPEVQALRRHLTALMESGAPAEVALNLHSAWDCKRYFVYHAAAGTSELFAQLQRRFIDFARARFPGGIEPWNYFVSWTTGTPDRYPESWFWLNYREQVMALTYEDMNCASAGSYDQTARALLGAAADYLGLTGVLDVDAVPTTPGDGLFAEVFPNPLSDGGMLSVRLTAAAASGTLRVSLCDLLGREIALLYEGIGDAAGIGGTDAAGYDGGAGKGRTLVMPAGHLPSGTYLLRAATRERVQTRPVVVIR